MTNTVTVGKRLIPVDHIALVEPFDPSAHPGMKSDKAFKARVVLVDRQSVLTEEESAGFAEAHGFRMLAEEGVATNSAIRFAVETFEPAEGFEPTKPFRSRLLWRDLEGNTQSKLLLSTPEVVLAAVVTGEGKAPSGSPTMARIKPATRERRRSRRKLASPEVA
jgi:hypothetical protein